MAKKRSTNHVAATPDVHQKVAVLMGGQSAERQVSLMSGSMILQALNLSGINAYAFDPSERDLSDLLNAGFSHAYIALHGRYGEDGTIQGALELLGIPYTGPGVQACAVSIDKVLSKQIWLANGLATPPFQVTSKAADASKFFKLHGPCVVKPPSEGSTLGLSKVTRASQMAAALKLAAQYEDRTMVEKMVIGRELTITVLGEGSGAHALPIIEICAPDANYDYQNKYFTDDTEFLCPAPLSAPLSKAAKVLAIAAYRALNCQGIARIDLMVDADEQPWLLELNASPGMTDHSLVPTSARADGLSYQQLVCQVLATASLKIGAGQGAR